MRELFVFKSFEDKDVPEICLQVTWRKKRPYFNVRDILDKVILSVGSENIWKECAK